MRVIAMGVCAIVNAWGGKLKTSDILFWEKKKAEPSSWEEQRDLMKGLTILWGGKVVKRGAAGV